MSVDGCSPGQRAFPNVLTVDVEEYFHPNAMDAAVDPSRWDDLPKRVEHNTHRVLDLLSEHDVCATFFVLGWVAERLPRLVVEIARRGHEVLRIAVRTPSRVSVVVKSSPRSTGMPIVLKKPGVRSA